MIGAAARQASLVAQFEALRSVDRFRDIWVDGLWLDDACELRRDHDAIEALMRVAATSDAIDQVRTALSLAIRLFQLHAQSDCPALHALRASIDYVLLLSEQIGADLADQRTVDDPAMITRIANLQLHLNLLCAIEREHCDDRQLLRSESRRSQAGFGEHRLRLRNRLLREARGFLETSGDSADTRGAGR